MVEKLSRDCGGHVTASGGGGYDSVDAGSLVVLLSSSDVTLLQCVLRSVNNFTKQSVYSL